MGRPVRITIIQTGPGTENKQDIIENNLKLLDEASHDRPDFIIFPELSTTQYFPTGTTDGKFFELADPIPGPVTDLFTGRAKKYGCHIILPFFEKGDREGEFYNSAVVIGRDGEIIHGDLSDGRKVKCYRKNHVGLVDFGDFQITEKYYMRPGLGFPVFKTDKAKIGILICYDRWFPESWRTLALQGAEIVFVPMASSYSSSGGGGELFLWSFRVWAHENLLFAVGCNKAGIEHVHKDIFYYGLSCITSPGAQIIQHGPEAAGPSIISAVIDLCEIEVLRKGLPYFNDRRTDIYIYEKL